MDDGKIHNPFKQLIVFGDFGQLPPVLREPDEAEYYKYYKSKYSFCSEFWNKCNFKYVILREVVRQKDATFAAKLERLRRNDKTVLKEFRQNDKASDTAITLCTRNTVADEINWKHLQALPGHHKYTASVIDNGLPDKVPVDFEMTLAPGEHVMFVNNDREGRWFNGSLAIVKECLDDSVIVEMHDGRTLNLSQYSWPVYRTEVKEVRYVGETKPRKEIHRYKSGSYCQYPLRPAWAITIHRSQGQTYDEVNIAPGNFFAPGQLYVALSRCRTEEGMHITGTLREEYLKFDQELLDFMDFVEKNAIN